MHEMGLMEDALEMVAADAKARGMNTVDKVSLIVGDLSNVLPDGLRFAFEAFCRSRIIPTLSETASLEIIPEKALARCALCGTTYEPSEYLALCPECGKPFGVLLAGETFKIESYEGG
ncbi:MAG: hydrogenase maturation nickel metallochaperone HypA [Sporolactobacillus sp.]